jgi:hypothetical protein
MEIGAKIRLRKPILTFYPCGSGTAARSGGVFPISALDWPSAIGVAQAIIANG